MIENPLNKMVSDLTSGIYVFESKNYSGWIFGNEKSKYWTQSLKGGKKNKSFNPIWQNKAHIHALKQVVVDINSEFYYSYIVFSERCESKKVSVETSNIKVIKRNQLKSNLKKDIKQKPTILSENEINRTYEFLREYTLADDEIRKKHIEDIKSRI